MSDARRVVFSVADAILTKSEGRLTNVAAVSSGIQHAACYLIGGNGEAKISYQLYFEVIGGQSDGLNG